MATSFRFSPMRALALLAAAGAMLTGCTTVQPASPPALLPACARRERLRSPLRPVGCGRSPM